MANMIELAKSGRSTCKSCGKKIAKGEPRFGLETFFQEHVSYKWYHLECAVDHLPDEVATAEVTIEIAEGTKEKVEKLKEQYASGDMPYLSKAWNRPRDKFVELEYAKTARAVCLVCEKGIAKGELKLMKPFWSEKNEQGNSYPSKQSCHLNCAIKDEHGEEMVTEVVSRLSKNDVASYKEYLKELLATLPETKAKELLENKL
jgi:hypothetical protein